MPELERLVAFGRALREEGLRPGTGALADFCRAAALLGAAEVYWAGRATLVSRRDEIPPYDRAFAAFFGSAPPGRPGPEPRPAPAAAASDGDGSGEAGEAARAEAVRASRIELLRRKSFDECTPAELRELARLAAAFARELPPRRSRRRARAPAGALDPAGTLRRSLRTGGEPFERRFRTRERVERRLVLLLDVSGSMAGTSQGLLVLAHALVHARPRVEVLCFGTRLTRVTRALACGRADEALRRVAAAVADWEGGTRIGESLRAFLDGGGRRGTARGAIVVVCSDGFDVGDPELLRTQMERLARLAHRVVWLNPLVRDAAYEPLARGMRAALPYVDVFASGHSLASVEAAALALSGPRSVPGVPAQRGVSASRRGCRPRRAARRRARSGTTTRCRACRSAR